MRFGCCVPLGTFVPPTGAATQLGEQDALDTRMQQLQEAIRIVEDAGCEFLELGVGVVAPEVRKEQLRVHEIMNCSCEFPVHPN